MAIDSNDLISPPITGRTRAIRIAFGLAAAWFVVHAAIYAGVLWCRLNFLYRSDLIFFGCQAVGFLGLAIFAATRRPGAAGRVLGGYLACSTLVLLALSQDAEMVVRLALLLLWTACAVEGMRQAIAWAVGERYATYGVAAAAVYAALVPIGFLLGIIHAITPSNVAALAIAVALPGAIFLLRRLSRWRMLSGSHPQRGDQAGERADRKPWGLFECCLLQVIWFVLAIEFIGASTSQLACDSARVHLPYMLRVVADHGISHQYACWHRLELMSAQTYGAVLISVGSIVAAQWFSWLALAALVLLVVEEVQRRCGSRFVGLFAGAAVLSCPMLARLSVSLSVDHVVALLCTAGFVVLFRALRPPCLRGILFSAAIVASMVQVKCTGLIFCTMWCLFLGIHLLRTRGWRGGLQWSAIAGAVLLTLSSPWYVYAYLGTGNPFYPSLNDWFPSPYWVNGCTYQQILQSENFKLPPGISGIALFPWTVTYFTGRFIEGYDGLLGFWAIALAPCLFFAWRRGVAPYWDMAIVGAAMIVGVVVYTPYVRYWTPAYPLLVASCVLAAGSLIGARGWRPQGRRSLLLAGGGMVLLLLLPAPLLCLDMPWAVYAKRVSLEDHLRQSYPEYDAVQRLNAILAPHDGVLCCGCSGVYLVGGRPYDFAFCWNAIHRIHDRDSFADFCRRYDIRYWMVDHRLATRRNVRGSEDIVAEYWSDARRVIASGTVAVYDVAALRSDVSSQSISAVAQESKSKGAKGGLR